MSYYKTIVCLANSRKPPSGRCIAGRERRDDGFGDWVRPVSSRPTEEVSEEERRYEDGTDTRVLDIVSIQMSGPRPHLHQRENHCIDDRYYWKKVGSAKWEDISLTAEDPEGSLWMNGYSSGHGDNDRVPESLLSQCNRSLYLIRPEKLTLVLREEGGGFGPARRRVRARFRLCGKSYCLVVTDPLVERALMAKAIEVTEIPDALLTISLGEVFHGFAYKLAAAVITPNGAVSNR